MLSIKLYSCCSCYAFRQSFSYFFYTKHVNCQMPFSTSLQKLSNLIPGILGCHPFFWQLPCSILMSCSGYHGHLPNLVIKNQKWRNTNEWMIINISANSILNNIIKATLFTGNLENTIVTNSHVTTQVCLMPCDLQIPKTTSFHYFCHSFFLTYHDN